MTSEAVLSALPDIVKAVPGCRGRLAGSLGWTRWHTDGPLPSVCTLEPWDGQPGAAFLTRPLNVWTGPIVEVLCGDGRLVVRTHHAAMDGRGTLAFVDALCACLRGESPPSATAGAPTDLELARALPVPAESSPVEDCLAPTGECEGTESATTWARRRFEGKVKRPVAAVAHSLAAAARKHGQGEVRVAVSVDMRRHDPSLQSTANLSGIVRLTPERTIAATDRALRSLLAAHLEGAFVLSVAPVRWLPLWLLTWAGRRKVTGVQQTSRYGTTATISNLGRQLPERFNVPGFKAQRSFWIPAGQPGLPLFLTLTGDATGVEIVGSMPVGLASRGRLDALMDAIVQGIGTPS